ncbi:3'-5' exonuclease [Psychrobium sp. 1_MG-2023]|uniref:3'-5' exonuclease n=1 Tax=Psychrobium sp. 1_MG-2023 TaxID=3062624 RepID=UPI000C31E3EF|nr:3'-5' exonuclease [Psychrobium sp. 1_MG-2023]MDP2562494.1 3'-5' exonuclease [Psychrobium sp. 1_MG-2023]PKF54327.1 DNA polymerase III subunit epsilon [Alteromonadales bacterium alter-6D02]
MSTNLSFAQLNRVLLGLKAKDPELKRFIRHSCDLSRSFKHSELLSVDLEMTGLDPKKNEVISMGWVPIINGEIILAEARQLLISPEQGVGDSATIHGIHDRDLANALSLEQGLEQLLAAMKGRVLVAHHGALDISFLQQAAQKLYGHKLPFELIDTLLIEAKRLSRQGEHFDKQLLRLYACCHRYGLPNASAHNALADALATAQLLLAQVAAISGGQTITLREIMKYSH